MNARRLFLSWLLVITNISHAADPQPKGKESYSAQVDAVLRSPWTEIHITQALITDYGEIHGVTLELSREKADGPVFYRADSKEEKKLMPAEQLQKLVETVIAAAKEVEGKQTPGEILSSVSAQEAARLMREKKLPPAWDVTEFVVFCSKPAGGRSLSNGGVSQKFTDFLEKEFFLKQREISRDESKQILDADPYDGLF